MKLPALEFTVHCYVVSVFKKIGTLPICSPLVSPRPPVPSDSTDPSGRHLVEGSSVCSSSDVLFPIELDMHIHVVWGNLQHIQWKRNSQLTVKSFSLELPRTHLPSLPYDSPSETRRQCVTLSWAKSTGWVRRTRVTSSASFPLSCKSQGKLLHFHFSLLQFFSWFIKWGQCLHFIGILCNKIIWCM